MFLIRFSAMFCQFPCILQDFGMHYFPGCRICVLVTDEVDANSSTLARLSHSCDARFSVDWQASQSHLLVQFM